MRDDERDLILPAQEFGIYRQLYIVPRSKLAVRPGAENLLILDIKNIFITIGTGLQADFFAKSLIEHDLKKIGVYRQIRNPFGICIVEEPYHTYALRA